MTEPREEQIEGAEPEAPPVRQPEARGVDRATQPYEFAALVLGGAVLLVGRGVLPGMELVTIVGYATFATLALWITLEVLRLQLPITVLCATSAILGLLYSLPLRFVYDLAWHNAEMFAVLLILMNGAGLLGAFFAGLINAQEHPYLAIIFSFFLLFVGVNVGLILYNQFSFI